VEGVGYWWSEMYMSPDKTTVYEITNSAGRVDPGCRMNCMIKDATFVGREYYMKAGAAGTVKFEEGTARALKFSIHT